MVKRLSAIPYGNVKVIINNDGSIDLQSYETIVATIDSDGWLKINGLYSMTTRKHIGAFVKEYCDIDYYSAKKLYEDNYKLNIHTGEIL